MKFLFFSFFKDIILSNFKFKDVKCLIADSIEINYFFHFLLASIKQQCIEYSQLHF